MIGVSKPVGSDHARAINRSPLHKLAMQTKTKTKDGQVIGMTGPSPPPRRQQLRSILGDEIRQPFRIPPILKLVLLGIGSSENIIPDEVDEHDECRVYRTEFDGREDEVASLKGIHERDPCEVAD